MPEEKPVEWWLEQITTHGVNLTAWEEDFIESMSERRTWSDRQIEIIERIYAERTP